MEAAWRPRVGRTEAARRPQGGREDAEKMPRRCREDAEKILSGCIVLALKPGEAEQPFPRELLR